MALLPRQIIRSISIAEPHEYVALFNGATIGMADYKIGQMRSTDGGVTWTVLPANPIITNNVAWKSSYVIDPEILWDGSQYVCYYAGFNGTAFAIGRATSANSETWTDYGSNPVLTKGSVGAFDEDGVSFPSVRYVPALSPAWQMWYQGFPAGASPVSPHGISIGYADSADGITWTKRGQVLGLGAGGSFDADALTPSAVYFDGTTYFVFYGGYSAATGNTRPSYATTTSPTGTYSKLGSVLSGFNTNLTIGGVTWRSSQIAAFLRRGSGLIAYSTFWLPASGTYMEAMGTRVIASSTLSIPVPPGLIIGVPGSGWDAYSAENLSVLAVA